METNALTCKLYLKGKCKQQDKCKGYHPPDCRDYHKGQCTRNQYCMFRHYSARSEPQAHPVIAANESASSQVDENKTRTSERTENMLRSGNCAMMSVPLMLHGDLPKRLKVTFDPEAEQAAEKKNKNYYLLRQPCICA